MNKAYDLARKAHDLQPQDASAGDTLGWVLYRRGDYQQALSILQESAQAGENSVIQFHLGMTAYMMGQTELAKTALRKAVNSADDFEGREEARRRLASLETGKPQSPELPLAQLEATTKQQPNDVVSQIQLGEAYQKQGSFDKAATAFEQALKLNPGFRPRRSTLPSSTPVRFTITRKHWSTRRRRGSLRRPIRRTMILLGEVAYQNGNFARGHTAFCRKQRVSAEMIRQLFILWGGRPMLWEK